MVKVGSKAKKKDDLKNIKDSLAENVYPISLTPRKKKELLTEVEQIFFGKMFNAYEAQYKSKSPLNHAMCVSLRKKLLRMHLLKEVKP